MADQARAALLARAEQRLSASRLVAPGALGINGDESQMCSTPVGIEVGCTRNGIDVSKDRHRVLNACRHRGWLHSATMTIGGNSYRCSTPVGIEVGCTARP